MEQIRFYGETRCPNLFDPTDQEEPPMKIGTEVFDCTMPSELEFDDESSNHQVQNPKGEFSIFDNKSDEGRKLGNILGEIDKNRTQVTTKADPSQYEMLTKSISTFSFHKNGSNTIGKPQYAKGSYIPHFLGVKTFPVKFRDENSELSNGVSKLQLFWKNVVGYIKVELYINANAVYLLERRKQGLLVRTAWSMANLFKVFSDREQRKARIIFRVTEENEVKLATKELQEVDFNLLATLLTEAGNFYDIESAI